MHPSIFGSPESEQLQKQIMVQLRMSEGKNFTGDILIRYTLGMQGRTTLSDLPG
jgi:hypothetical protein